jgi:hypothetical protein
MKFKSNATINLFLMSGYRIIAKNKQSARNKKPQSKHCYFEVSLFILRYMFLYNLSYKFFFRVTYFFQVHQPVIHFIAITYRQ